MGPRLVAPRYYVDEDVQALGKLLGQVKIDVTYVGDPGRVHNRRERPACDLVHRSDLDEDWIPRVAASGMLIITRDSQIHAHTRLLTVVRDSGARMVALAGKDAGTPFEQLRTVLAHWDAIEALPTTGPFIYSVTRTTFREVPL